jgi:mannitol/fructose-specific phosphotransferase system IIA component
MSLESMIPSGAVVVPLLATDVDEALVELSQALAHAHGLRADRVLPHGRGEVEHTVGALGISPRGVRWGDARVHMVVALLSPLEGSEHVKALARIGRVLSDARLTAALREVTSAPQAHALLVGVSQ